MTKKIKEEMKKDIKLTLYITSGILLSLVIFCIGCWCGKIYSITELVVCAHDNISSLRGTICIYERYLTEWIAFGERHSWCIDTGITKSLYVPFPCSNKLDITVVDSLVESWFKVKLHPVSGVIGAPAYYPVDRFRCVTLWQQYKSQLNADTDFVGKLGKNKR